MGKYTKPRHLAWHIVFVKNIIDTQRYFVEHDPHCSMVCFEITFSKNLYYIEISHIICFVDQLIGFYMIQGFTESYFQTGYSVVKFQGKNVLKILFVNIYFRKVTLSLV